MTDEIVQHNVSGCHPDEVCLWLNLVAVDIGRELFDGDIELLSFAGQISGGHPGIIVVLGHVVVIFRVFI